MPIDWPSGLPSAVLEDGYSEQFADNLIETKMESGPPKARRRSTAFARPLVVRQLLTTAQVATLETFYYTTTASGSLSFTRTHPRTGSATLRFTSPPPSIAPAGPGHWFATYNLLVLP